MSRTAVIGRPVSQDAVAGRLQIIFSESVNSGDAMPIVYLYELFLTTGRRDRFGRIPKLWLCALTIVHELSHKLVGTKDIRYDDQGLKPSPAFPHDKAVVNADSWAYFCGDVLGAVPQQAVTSALS